MNDSDAIKVIRRDLHQHRVLCFVGAGLSCRAGIVTWDELLARLEEQLSHGAPDIAAQFESHCKRKEMAQAGDVYKKSRLFDSDKQSLFDELFIRDRHPTTLHKALIGLGFEGILTTNYDHLIEDAYALVHGRSLRAYLPVDLAASDLQFRGMFLAKLHGDAYNWRTVILGLDDYSKAVWPASVRPILKEKTLLVLGFGGRDHLVNQLFLQADTSHVYVVMPAEEAMEYREHLVRARGSVPEHIKLVSVEHSMLETFLDRLTTQLGTQHVVDSPWGRMPPHPVAMDYVHASSELRAFYGSKRRAICVVGPPSSGLSSFIASEAEIVSLQGGMTVCRLEGKTWLPLQAYLLHLLANLPRVVYDSYLASRREEIGGWDDLKEARALALALNVLSEPVLLFHEHADRLCQQALAFWQALLDHVDARFKLILACPAPVSTSTDIARVDLGRPTDASLRALCQHYAHGEETGSAIANALPGRDLQTLVLAARLAGNMTLSLEGVVRVALSSGTRGLLDAALKAVANSKAAVPNIQLLRACVVFRTPRNERALSECAQISDDAVVRDGLALLCQLGFLIPPHVGQVEAYAMSTTTRAMVDGMLGWGNGEREQYACRAADYFKMQSVDALDSNQNRSETDVIGAVPLASCALFHYSEARDFNSCAQIVSRMRPYLQNMCHFGILETWVHDTGLFTDPSVLTARSRYSLAYLKARLDRVKSITTAFQRHLSAAEEALAEVARGGEPCEKEQADIRFEKGILLTMQRRYPEALAVFQEEQKQRGDLKSLERIIQTLMSLGKLGEAEDCLAELFARLKAKGDVQGVRALSHDYSMAFRHKSTLSGLRLLLYDHRPKGYAVSRQALLEGAIEAATVCRKYSEDTGPSASRHTVSDKTGLGVAELKMGQAYYAALQYTQASQCAVKGAGLLAGFPNSRWWRMSCHDLAARALAMLNEVPAAREQLSLALAAFQDSGKEDTIRECELARTQGIIELAAGDVPSAVALLKGSLDFAAVHQRVSPCIEIAHLSDLARGQLALGELHAARCTLRRALTVKIQW